MRRALLILLSLVTGTLALSCLFANIFLRPQIENLWDPPFVIQPTTQVTQPTTKGAAPQSTLPAITPYTREPTIVPTALPTVIPTLTTRQTRNCNKFEQCRLTGSAGNYEDGTDLTFTIDDPKYPDRGRQIGSAEILNNGFFIDLYLDEEVGSRRIKVFAADEEQPFDEFSIELAPN